MKNTIENRRHARLFFSPADKVIAQLEISGQELTEAMVLDISESGIGLSVKRDEEGIFEPGDRFIMAEIQGLAAIHFDFAIEVEVRWLLDHEYLGRVAFGCLFINMPKIIRSELRDFVAERL
jgi:c-di-GMP-binding flagellar brake protein YcgR